MKKFMVALMVAVLLTGLLPLADAQAQGSGRGGIGGLLVGCCFGIRTAGEWNEGKDLHWREWCTRLPYVGVIFSIWDGVEGVQGRTTTSLADEYGANFY